MHIKRWSLYKYNRKIGMSIPNAAIAAGYPRSLVDKHTTSMPVPTKYTGNTDFFALFEQKQMTDVKKVEHAIAGMSATKTIVVKETPTSYREIEVPDWTARHKYYETMLKLCKQLEKTDEKNVHLHLSGDFATRLKEARERATEEMKHRMVQEVDVPQAQKRSIPRAEIVEEEEMADVD